MALILFDLVSTLVNSGPRYAEAYIRACEEFGHHRIPTRTTLMHMLGDKGLKQIIAECSPEITTEQILPFMQKCNETCDAILTEDQWQERLYPDVMPTLKALKKLGHVLGIYTGTREDALMAQVHYHGLQTLFDAQLIEGKDNQRDQFFNSIELKTRQMQKIKARYEQIHLQHDEVIVIGDSSADFYAAIQAGLKFIGIARDGNSFKKLQLLGVEVILSSLKDLPAFITNGIALPELKINL